MKKKHIETIAEDCQIHNNAELKAFHEKIGKTVVSVCFLSQSCSDCSASRIPASTHGGLHEPRP